MSPELKGVIIGSLISSIVLIANTIIQSISARNQRKSDEKIKYREAIFRLAFDNWQAELPHRTPHMPLEEYLIRMDSMHRLFIEENPSADKVAAKLNAFNLLKEQWAKQR